MYAIRSYYDTNVLVFERIREELRNGKTVRAAVQNSYNFV